MKTRLIIPMAIALVATSFGGAALASEGATTENSGGIITVGLYQEPDNLNPYLAAQTASELVRTVALEGLLDADPEGNYIPILAEVVPTVENGGISEDGLTITYTLKEGLLWSDGTPLTSADVKFTWDSIMDPANAVNSQTGYDQIASIHTPDDRTVVLNFKELYAPAFSLFGVKDAVLPKHVLEGQAFDNPDYSRAPLGTGPFKFTQWTSGDSIIVDRNENFRDA
ncbi:MAG: ABC transporter substrate-binding protein, partial [Chloroflexota bacterium]